MPTTGGRLTRLANTLIAGLFLLFPGNPAFGKDDTTGAQVLAPFFPPLITECVGLHVAAKRYLCAVDPDYLDQLSIPSVHSLELQGGPMNEAEIAKFESHSFHREAVMLRKWDDAGKVAGMETKSFADYAPLLQQVVDAHARAN